MYMRPRLWIAFFFFPLNVLFIYLFFEKEREHEGRAERESQIGSMLSTEPDMGLEPMNFEIMT